MMVGSATTRLITLRGNSASGKTSVAAEVRARYGRGIALVGQDNLRRVVLRERDVPDGVNIGLIDTVARYALANGYRVVVEGILYATHYSRMLDSLRRDHRGQTHQYYLDVPYNETLRRHATKPQAGEYGAAEMHDWYRPLDVLPGGAETVIPATSTLKDTVSRVMMDAELTTSPEAPPIVR